jgi:predicted subunit of tRNA(5-methylaminomethyl-2-thiouridylate) methyltransferase
MKWFSRSGDLPIAAVMFSGGRDSSLAAVIYCTRGFRVQLLRFRTGFGIPSPLPEIREAELRTRFHDTILPTPDPIGVYGLVRRIAVAEIEDDFRQFSGKNLVLLGEKLALHAASIVYCLNNEIEILADGTSGYQAEMPEQRDTAIDFFRELAQHYGIQYETPVKSATSDNDVKYALLEAGISTKSLEGISMFADSFSIADDDTVRSYLELKKAHAVSYIERFAANAPSEELRLYCL